MSEATKRALRENTELQGRVAAMTESLQVRPVDAEQRQALPLVSDCVKLRRCV